MPEYKKDSSEKNPSRREEFRGYGIEVTMPECDAEYLAAYLFEIGPTMAGGMGDVPLSHSEIRAWMDNTGIELDSWEARIVKELSGAYLSEINSATDPTRQAPWAEAPYLKIATAKRLQLSIERMVRE